MESLFQLTLSPWELILRGSAVYWFLFIIFRFVMHRDVGSLAIADVLLLVLVADASQNAMAGEYKSITDGFILVATIIGWNYLLDWAAYRFPAVAKLAEPPPLLLVRRGRMLKGSLRQEMLTEDDLMSKLREHGVEDVAQVKKAYIEGDGSVTVIRFGQAPADPAGAKKEKPV
jgi:uncharacterized membrane protein YcaP (DUF421 family)